jgi:hypothetical protein
MKNLAIIGVALGACGFATGNVLNHEPFDYPAADLSGNNGGTGWPSAWTDSGNPSVVSAAGLTYSDASGRILDVSGKAVTTADGGATTTVSLRDLDGTLNDVWISFLYQLPAANNKFEGITFYREAQKVFSVSNPSTNATAAIFLTNDLFGNNGVNTGKGVFGKTHLIVLKLTKGGGAEGVDRVEAFIDPFLAEVPTTPTATVDGANFDINRVRIAGQDGNALLIDELRVGTTWEDVSPHTTPADVDSDGDGLTDSQETQLGLDPNMSNAAFFAALRANSAWFSLHSPEEVADASIGGLRVTRPSPTTLGYTFDLRDASGATTETVDRPVTSPPLKRFFRLKIAKP